MSERVAGDIALDAGDARERPCDDCLASAWLLGRLAAHLEPVRGRIEAVLSLDPDDLIDAVGGDHRQALRRELDRFEPDGARAHSRSAGLEAICRCDPRYPPRLLALERPPAVLHVAGGSERFLELVDADPVAIVGARRASGYGLDVARALGRGLGSAGVSVISGMAMGVDSAAHAGAVEAAGATVAVLPAGADRPYPAGKRSLYRQICESGAAISELAPGTDVWRWMFPARNRVIAALAAMTIVVEAGERSGSLVTATIAHRLGRIVGAVPGRVTSSHAVGPNGLLAAGGAVVRGPQDILDLLFGHGVQTVKLHLRAPLDPGLQRLLAAVAAGNDTPAALSRAGLAPGDGLAALASLELAGYVRREPGGRFSVLP
jgi:DNA processing protein